MLCSVIIAFFLLTLSLSLQITSVRTNVMNNKLNPLSLSPNNLCSNHRYEQRSPPLPFSLQITSVQTNVMSNKVNPPSLPLSLQITSVQRYEQQSLLSLSLSPNNFSSNQRYEQQSKSPPPPPHRITSVQTIVMRNKVLSLSLSLSSPHPLPLSKQLLFKPTS